jgi:hypothetical protein
MSASANGLKIVLMRKWTPDEGTWQVLHGFNVIHEPQVLGKHLFITFFVLSQVS